MLKKILKKAIDNETGAEAIAQSARKRIIERFSVEKSVENLARIYKDLIT